LSFQVWHVAKGLNKVLAILAKQNPNLADWTKSISNHVWYAAENCQESEDELIRIWEALLYHIQDIHEWTDADGTQRKCGHEELGEDRVWKNWLTEEEIQMLKKVKKTKL